MNKRVKSSIGCAVLFILSAVIFRYGNNTGLPSEDYSMSVKEVFYMYEDESPAITPVSAEHILNKTDEKALDSTMYADSEDFDVLPPVLKPPKTSFASDIN